MAEHPNVGKTFYCMRSLPGHTRICPEEIYRDDPEASLGTVNRMINNVVTRDGRKNVVVDAENAKRETRDSITAYITHNLPTARISHVRITPNGESLQCRWAMQYALAERADVGRPKYMQDPYAWFRQNENVKRDDEMEVKTPLICDSPFQMTIPVFIIQRRCLPSSKDEPGHGGNVTKFVKEWCDAHPTGRVIIVDNPTAEADSDETRLPSIRAAATLLREACGRPVYYWLRKLIQPRYAGFDMFDTLTSGSLALAWLQRRHMFSLTCRDSKYLGVSKTHKRLAKLVRIAFVNSKDPYASDPTEKRAVVDRKYDWMAHVECVNISGTPRETAGHIPFCGPRGVADKLEEVTEHFYHGVVISTKSSTLTYNEMCRAALALHPAKPLSGTETTERQPAHVSTLPPALPTSVHTPVEARVDSAVHASVEAPMDSAAVADGGDSDAVENGEGDAPRRVVSKAVLESWVKNPNIIKRASDVDLQEIEETDSGGKLTLTGKCASSSDTGVTYGLKVVISLPCTGPSSFEYSCDCPYKKRGVCKHLVALVQARAMPDTSSQSKMFQPVFAGPPRPPKPIPRAERITFGSTPKSPTNLFANLGPRASPHTGPVQQCMPQAASDVPSDPQHRELPAPTSITTTIPPPTTTRRLPAALQRGSYAPASPKETAPKASKKPKPGEHQSATRGDVPEQHRTPSAPKKTSATRQARSSSGLNIYYLQAAELRAYLAKQYPDRAQAAQGKAAPHITGVSQTRDDVPAVSRADGDLSQRSAVAFTNHDSQHTPGRLPRLSSSGASSFDIGSSTQRPGGLGARGPGQESLSDFNARSHSRGGHGVLDGTTAIAPARQLSREQSHYDSMLSLLSQPRPKRTHDESTPEPEVGGTGSSKRMRPDELGSYPGQSGQAAPAASQGRFSQGGSQADRAAAAAKARADERAARARQVKSALDIFGI